MPGGDAALPRLASSRDAVHPIEFAEQTGSTGTARYMPR